MNKRTNWLRVLAWIVVIGAIGLGVGAAAALYGTPIMLGIFAMVLGGLGVALLFIFPALRGEPSPPPAPPPAPSLAVQAVESAPLALSVPAGSARPPSWWRRLLLPASHALGSRSGLGGLVLLQGLVAVLTVSFKAPLPREAFEAKVDLGAPIVALVELQAGQAAAVTEDGRLWEVRLHDSGRRSTDELWRAPGGRLVAAAAAPAGKAGFFVGVEPGGSIVLALADPHVRTVCRGPLTGAEPTAVAMAGGGMRLHYDRAPARVGLGMSDGTVTIWRLDAEGARDHVHGPETTAELPAPASFLSLEATFACGDAPITSIALPRIERDSYVVVGNAAGQMGFARLDRDEPRAVHMEQVAAQDDPVLVTLYDGDKEESTAAAAHGGSVSCWLAPDLYGEQDWARAAVVDTGSARLTAIAAALMRRGPTILVAAPRDTYAIDGQVRAAHPSSARRVTHGGYSLVAVGEHIWSAAGSEASVCEEDSAVMYDRAVKRRSQDLEDRLVLTGIGLGALFVVALALRVGFFFEPDIRRAAQRILAARRSARERRRRGRG